MFKFQHSIIETARGHGTWLVGAHVRSPFGKHGSTVMQTGAKQPLRAKQLALLFVALINDDQSNELLEACLKELKAHRIRQAEKANAALDAGQETVRCPSSK